MLPLPSPTFDCAATFGPLCAAAGIGSLSAVDVQNVRAAGLKRYLYEAPAEFHRQLYESKLPPKVSSSKLCDFRLCARRASRLTTASCTGST